ncbi:MAG TPA: cupin domain-containing protein [Polyangia bacterium]|nr:cupin domain-containing protein [Polyangia bacterium]
MSDVTVKQVGELSYYQGPKAIAGIKFRSAAKDLGVSAWGMNVIEIDAGCTAYPEHDHAGDGQEEVYVVLAGSATMHAGGKELAIESGALVRVPPGTKRKIVPGPRGVTVLAIGATPGKAYEPRR